MKASPASAPHGLLLVAGALTAVTLALPAMAAKSEATAPGTYALKDGTTLFVAQNGQMRMFTADGNRLNMKDGVPMQTRDGKVVVMKEDLNWRQLRRYGTLNPKFH